MKRLAYVAEDGQTVDLSPEDAERLLEHDPELEREYAKWQAMTRSRGGRLIVLDAARVRRALARDDSVDDAT